MGMRLLATARIARRPDLAGKQWHAVFPSNLIGNQRGGFVLAPPLPPLGCLISGNPFPLLFSSDGVLASAPVSMDPAWRRGSSEKCLRFDDLIDVKADGGKVRVNGRTL